MTLLSWKDSPNGRRSKAQGVDGEYRIGRYDTEAHAWSEQGIVVPAETWFVVGLHIPGQKRPVLLAGYLERIGTMEAAKALAQAHYDKTEAGRS
jgi:hypothetical protein